MEQVCEAEHFLAQLQVEIFDAVAERVGLCVELVVVPADFLNFIHPEHEFCFAFGEFFGEWFRADAV